MGGGGGRPGCEPAPAPRLVSCRGLATGPRPRQDPGWTRVQKPSSLVDAGQPSRPTAGKQVPMQVGGHRKGQPGQSGRGAGLQDRPGGPPGASSLQRIVRSFQDAQHVRQEQFLTRPFNRPMRKQVCKGHLFTRSAQFTAPWEEQKLRPHRFPRGSSRESGGGEPLLHQECGVSKENRRPRKPGNMFPKVAEPLNFEGICEC